MKKIKDIQIRKVEDKLSLLADDINIYIYIYMKEQQNPVTKRKEIKDQSRNKWERDEENNRKDQGN